MIRLKRAYDKAEDADGERILVDRLWPRGIVKEKAHLADWLKNLAPSNTLRTWFGHDPARWQEFRERYREELSTPEKKELLGQLAVKANDHTVTLIYAAKDESFNNAVVIRELIEEEENESQGHQALL